MIDVDHFKQFNDRHGHRFGDQVLKLVAHVLTANVKGRDTVARYGGEEFAIILPDTDMSDAMRVAETLRGSVESRRIVKRGSKKSIGTLTVSVGVAAYRLGEDVGLLIERADDAVYAAKAQGRNCVVANEESSDTLSCETAQNETEQQGSTGQSAQLI